MDPECLRFLECESRTEGRFLECESRTERKSELFLEGLLEPFSEPMLFLTSLTFLLGLESVSRDGLVPCWASLSPKLGLISFLIEKVEKKWLKRCLSSER